MGDWDEAQCLAAMRGQRLPDEASLAKWLPPLAATVRGIRHDLLFATSPEVVAFCSKPTQFRARLARARHARLIMSDMVPDMTESAPEDYPYCIWHPQVASEATYRELYKRYPSLRYQIGRACAVAGYIELYEDMDLLPDASIAEEARESKHGAAIFDKVMSQPMRYAIMDDYTLSVSETPEGPAFLNRDAATIPSFQRVYSVNSIPDMDEPFDIAEDLHIGESNPESGLHYRLDQVELLYTPLPADLPVVDKSLLICMAAYEGNVDRYARLRRPIRPSTTELACIVRGVYHSTTFAKWWSVKLETCDMKTGPDTGSIEKAINARAIMCNDLSRVPPDLEKDHWEWAAPYMIWWPLKPSYETLEKLLQVRPSMKMAVAHACIACDYQRIFDSLDMQADALLAKEARLSHNKHYLEYLQRCADEQGEELLNCEDPSAEFIHVGAVTRFDKEPTTLWLPPAVGAGNMDWNLGGGLYDDLEARSAAIELFLWAHRGQSGT